MASMESALVINFILNIIIFVVGIIVALLIPSNKKIREGAAGTSMGARWIIPVLLLMLILTILVFPLSLIFQKGANLVLSLVLDIIALLITTMAIFIYMGARRTYRELHGEGPYETVEAVAVHHHHGTPHDHSTPHTASMQPRSPAMEAHHAAFADHAAGMMTVECPQCGGHIHIREDSHSITCPYCGLTGTI